MKKLGLVIADDGEFAPVEKLAISQNGKVFTAFSDKYVSFSLNVGDKTVEIVAVLSGVGKVNAAGATAALIISQNVDTVINFGLSGAINNVRKNEIVIGTKFIEHDFDISALGYEIGQKPQDISHFLPDKALNEMIISSNDNIKPCVFVTGDTFVSDSEKKKFIIDKFDGGCCDMESAAIASVCYKAGVPFASIRLMSDDADESAANAYSEANAIQDDILMNIVINAVKKSIM